jgi:hypothetical protein
MQNVQSANEERNSDCAQSSSISSANWITLNDERSDLGTNVIVSIATAHKDIMKPILNNRDALRLDAIDLRKK